MALCATTALAGAVSRPCVRGARGRFGGGSGRYLVLCLSCFPLPAPRVPRCVRRAVPSGCPLPSLAGTPFHAVCAFRALGPVALPVVPACPFRVCALALSRCPLPPPLGGVARASRAVPALGAGRAVPLGPCPSACPAPVPCSVWRAWGGAVRSRFPPSWLGVVGVAAGRPRGGCLLPLRGAPGVMRSPSPDCPPTGRAVGVRHPRVVGAGVRVWGPCSVPSAGTPCGGCAPRGASVARSYSTFGAIHDLPRCTACCFLPHPRVHPLDEQQAASLTASHNPGHGTKGDIKGCESRLGASISPRFPTLDGRPRPPILPFWQLWTQFGLSPRRVA